MDSIKIQNFKMSHPAECFPQYRSLAGVECGELRRRLAKLLGIDLIMDTLMLVRRLHERPSIDLGVVPESGSLDVGSLVKSRGFKCGAIVYINWYRFDDVDEMSLVDLSRFFDDIWYPGSDDIEIMDESTAWVILVDHNGQMRFIGLSED